LELQRIVATDSDAADVISEADRNYKTKGNDQTEVDEMEMK